MSNTNIPNNINEKLIVPEPGHDLASPPSHEAIPAPEQSAETSSVADHIETSSADIKGEGELGLGSQQGASPQADYFTKREKEIESLLSDGLEDIYMGMTAEKQREFKMLGEETARKINMVIDKANTRLKDVMKLIWRWLKIIPGVNKFFLEQEAKIKSDKIMRIKDGEKQ